MIALMAVAAVLVNWLMPVSGLGLSPTRPDLYFYIQGSVERWYTFRNKLGEREKPQRSCW